MAQNKLIASPTDDDVIIIKKWLRSQSHLPNYMDEKVVKKFLFCCNHSLQVTKSTIDLYHTLRNNAPEIFACRDPLDPVIQQVHKVVDFLPLPKLTKDKNKMILFRMIDHDPDHFTFNNIVKVFFMMADVRVMSEDEMSHGEVPIFDATGFSLRHLTKIVLSTLKKYMQYTQEAQPIKLKQIHIINASPLIQKLIAILRPLTKDEVFALMHFHTVGSDTLFDFVPREFLPEELGGSCGSMASIKQDWMKKVESCRDYLMDDNIWKVQESLRPRENKIIKSVILEGSFRSLAID